MNDAILEFLNELHNKGISWGAVITVLILFNKIQRNKEFRLRDQRVERNQRRIMEHLGVEGEWATPQKTLLQMVQQNLKKLYSSFYKDTQQGNQRRKTMLTNILKANLSKKLIALLVGVAVTALNNKLGLNLSQEEIYALLITVLGYIAGQSHVDAKKAISSTVSAVSQVAQSSVIPNDVTEVNSVPLRFGDLIPYINEVAATINKVSNDYKSKDINAVDQDAVNLIMSIHSFIKKAG